MNELLIPEIFALGFLTFALMGAFSLPLIRKHAERQEWLNEGAPTRFEKHEGDY